MVVRVVRLRIFLYHRRNLTPPLLPPPSSPCLASSTEDEAWMDYPTEKSEKLNEKDMQEDEQRHTNEKK